MTERPSIIVGFVPVLASIGDFADRTVILIEEPDVIRKRDIGSTMAGASMLRELVEWEYHLPGAADVFFNTRPDLNPAMVMPLVEYATPFAARLAERYGLPGAGGPASWRLPGRQLTAWKCATEHAWPGTPTSNGSWRTGEGSSAIRRRFHALARAWASVVTPDLLRSVSEWRHRSWPGPGNPRPPPCRSGTSATVRACRRGPRTAPAPQRRNTHRRD